MNKSFSLEDILLNCEASLKREMDLLEKDIHIEQRIKKVVENRTLLIHPAFFYKLKETGTLKRTLTLTDIYKLYTNTVTSFHSSTYDIPMSQTFLKESVQYYSNQKIFYEIRDIFFKETHRGNTLDSKGCSSFRYKYPLLRNKIINEGLVYINEEDRNNIYKKVLKNEMSLEEYKEIYKNQQQKNLKSSSKQKNLEYIARCDNKVKKQTNEQAKKQAKKQTNEPKEQKENKKPIKTKKFKDSFAFTNGETNIITEYLKDIQHKIEYLQEEITNNPKTKDISSLNFALKSLERQHDEISGLLECTHQNKIYFQNALSITNGREYNLFTSLSKSSRSIIFSNFTSLDVSNMAPVSIHNFLNISKKDFPNFSKYAFNRKDVISYLSDFIYTAIYNKEPNRRKNTYQQIKKDMKTLLLSLLFGKRTTNPKSLKRGEEIYEDFMNGYNVLKYIRNNNDKIMDLYLYILMHDNYIKGLVQEIKELSKTVHKKYNMNLSNFFMKIETSFINRLNRIIQDNAIDRKPRAVRIHDELLIETKDINFYPNLKPQLENLCKQYGFKLSNKDELYKNIDIQERNETNDSIDSNVSKRSTISTKKSHTSKLEQNILNYSKYYYYYISELSIVIKIVDCSNNFYGGKHYLMGSPPYKPKIFCI